MSASSSTTKTVSALLVAAVAWLAVGFQWYLTEESLTNFFSYFTILCNLLIAVTLTCATLLPGSGVGQYFSRVSVQTAVALYIFIVGLVYNLVLRGIWQFTGLQLLVDNVLHVVTPILYLLYWFLFVPKGRLHWRDSLDWVYFPLAYLVYSLIRGPMVHWYPYPFLNAGKLGYPAVFLNITVILVAFFVAGFVLIAINKALGKRNKPA